MLDRVYSVNFDNPHDVARDLLAHGFTQLMSEQKSKLMYVVLNIRTYAPLLLTTTIVCLRYWLDFLKRWYNLMENLKSLTRWKFWLKRLQMSIVQIF